MNTAKKKTGGGRPKISGGVTHCNLTLPADLIEWAKAQPEGLSGLARVLLAKERENRTAQPKKAAPKK